MGKQAGGIEARQGLALAGLACSAFVFNTSEFMPIGLLSDIAASFALTEAQAGVMISVYAWGIMLLSLPLMVFASRFNFKRLLIAIVALFAAGQFCSAVAPAYPALVAARLIVAAAHAVFWSVTPILATRVVDECHSSLALSVVATGTSVATIFGLPIGRVIGLAVGWRATFFVVGVIALALVAYHLAIFPQLPAGERFTLGQLPGLLKNRVLMSLFLATALIATGYYTGYSYIEPFLMQVAGLPAGAVTTALMVFGVSGLVGSLLFNRLYDVLRLRFLAVMVAAVAVALGAMSLAAGAGLAGVIGMCVVWGIGATAFNVAFQSELITYSSADESTVAMSIFSGIFNLGIGCGSAAGGLVVTHLGLGAIGFAGGAVALAGCLVTWIVMFGAMRAADARRFAHERRG